MIRMIRSWLAGRRVARWLANFAPSDLIALRNYLESGRPVRVYGKVLVLSAWMGASAALSLPAAMTADRVIKGCQERRPAVPDVPADDALLRDSLRWLTYPLLRGIVDRAILLALRRRAL